MQDSATAAMQSQDNALLVAAIDKIVWERCSSPKFNALWAGQWQGRYPSQSEADSALVYMLARQTNDMRQITRMFMESGLGERLRTGKKRKHENYVFDMVSDAMRDKPPIARIELDGEWEKAKAKAMSKQEAIVPQITSAATLPQRQVIVEGFDDMRIDITEWLWYRHLPKKRLALLAGVGSAGKSTLTLKMAATVSSGGTWPDGTQCPQGGVLLWSGEDIATEDVLPRLVAMGADLTRVFNIKGTRDERGQVIAFNPVRDIPEITRTLAANPGIALVVISPLVSMVKGDMNATNITREGLQALVDMAQQANVCVLGITHFRKDSAGQSPVDRVLGSAAFTQLPRVVMGAVRSADGTRRALAVIKGNNGKESLGAYEYDIRGKEITHKGVTVSAENCSEIVWGEFIPGAAQEIFDAVEGVEIKGDKQQSKVDGAKSFLTGQLANGRKVPTKELNELAAKCGISIRAYNQAKAELSVTSLPDGVGKPWVSSLPDTRVQIDIPVPQQWARRPN